MDAGLSYENVEFPARDGLRLSGWFIPRPTPATTVMCCTHGQAAGSANATSLLANISSALPIDLLHFAHACIRPAITC